MMFVTLLVISIPFVLIEIVLVNIKSYYMMAFHILFFSVSTFALFKGGCTDPGIIPLNQLVYNLDLKILM